jgi:uncharacterized protein (TIGR00251 family)
VGLLTPSASGVICAVRVTPRAGRTAIAGIRDDMLLVKLAAAPVDGAANAALIALLAEVFDLPRRDLSILSGHNSRLKRVEVRGVTLIDATARLSTRLNT